jgi:hypothetical protein
LGKVILFRKIILTHQLCPASYTSFWNYLKTQVIKDINVNLGKFKSPIPIYFSKKYVEPELICREINTTSSS